MEYITAPAKEMTISEEKIGGVSIEYCELMMMYPRPRSEAMNSPTITPITLMVVQILRPENIKGSELGMRIL